MCKSIQILCSSLVVFSAGILQADQPGTSSDADFFSSFPTENATPAFPETSSSEPAASYTPISSEPSLAAPKKPKIKTQFKPFTGKVKGKKVRLRTQPDLDSSVAKELERGEYLSIVDEEDDFWGVEAPSDIKSYVFRSFVLDNVIEGNRVNVRLQPNTDAPVIMHLNSGDQINGTLCASNQKWIEIPTPSSVRFYIAKNYVENVGGPEVKAEHDTRLQLVKGQLDLAEYFAETELKKGYSEIDFDKMNHNYQMIIQEFSDFPRFVEKARDALSLIQEKFIDKRIAYMEAKIHEEEPVNHPKTNISKIHSITDKMKLWEPVEEALYLSWASTHDSQTQDEYQLSQKIAAEHISGILEPYLAPVKCKPGDYIVKQNDLPVGYVYSTTVNLQDLIGKKVNLLGTPRPNNNFAFPAYFVIGVED